MRWLARLVGVASLFALSAIVGFLIAVGVWAVVVDAEKPAEAPPDPPPIGYTLYDVTNNRIIDIQPCPHPWGQFPTFQSFDQWMPNFGRKYDFGNGFSTLGGVFLELRPKGYVAPAECGQAYD